MSQLPQNQPTQSAPIDRTFDPGHVMTREHYERLAREAAGQK
jgi:hypothetical protein